MARKAVSAFTLDHTRDDVITRAEFYAQDPKNGMDLLELEKAIGALHAQPTVSRKGYKLKVTVGWKQQVQAVIFEEVDGEALPKTA